MLDIFGNSAFTETRLTDTINDITFVPRRIGQMGLFAVSTVETTKIAIERQGDILVLVPPTPRGAPGITLDKSKRDVRDVPVPHFEVNDSITADEVQDVREFGSERALQTVMGRVAKRLQEHQNSFAATEEYARIGAIKGVVTYADGSSLDMFDLFGVVQEAEIDFDLLAAAPFMGALRTRCQQIHEQVADLLGGLSYQGLHAFFGSSFFNSLIAHAEVRATFLNHEGASDLRNSYVHGGASYGTFNFGGIVWEAYRGKVGATNFIGTDEAHIFPTGVADLFRTVYAPADYIAEVNNMGKRLYTHQYPFPNQKGIHLDSQMNALQYCTRPKVLLKGTRGTAP